MRTGYNVVMKTTDIPNGFVYLNKMGNNTLVDFDDNGKIEDESQMVSIAGWPDDIMNKGLVNKELIVLVHSVKGSEGMLVKRLVTVKMERDGKPISVMEIIRIGKIRETVEKIWDEYMLDLKVREKKLGKKKELK